jgi:hypothetical protein
MGAAWGDDDASIGGQIWAQEVEEQRVADMIYGEGLFDAVVCIGDISGELETSIHDQGGDWWIGFGGIWDCEFADFAEGIEVEGKAGDVGLAKGLLMEAAAFSVLDREATMTLHSGFWRAMWSAHS